MTSKAHTMSSTLDPEYNKMLTTPALLQGPRKDAIDSLQKRIDFFIGEANRLRYAQNSHVVISRLPAELLSDVFLYVVESGLLDDDTCFSPGTFNFLQVCRRWHEVAVAFPGLWVWWVAGAGKLWHVFNARSKGAPLFLTWQPGLLGSAQDTFTTAEIPRRIRRLNFCGSRAELERLLGALDPSSTSITSSIQMDTYWGNNGEHLTRFLSLPFPRLSELAVVDILLDPSSAIFTTSNLTSLTLSFGYDGESQYTRSQLSQILQGQPNLQKLVLHGDALPPIEGSGTLAPIVLPRLVDLRLYGMGTFVAGFMVLVSMSPLHNVVIHIQSDRGPTFPVPSEAIKQILTAYYECQELEHPRKVDHLTVSMRHLLVVNASSSPTPACHPTYSLTLQAFEMGSAVVAGILSLFPLEHICVFAATELDLIEDDWHTVLQEMKGLMHLRFDSLEVGPVLDALGLDDEVEPYPQTSPKLQSLSLRDLDILSGQDVKLLDVLQRRSDYDIGLKSLVIQLCRVPTGGYREELEERVEEVTWEGVEEISSDYDESALDGPDSLSDWDD